MLSVTCHTAWTKQRAKALGAVKSVTGRAIDKAQNRILHDIDFERQRLALERTAAFVDEHMADSRSIRGRTARASARQIMDLGLALAPQHGLVLEFGVATGETLRHIAARRLPAHGFDSFEGLPERWRAGVEAGHFAQRPPETNGADLHIGWFDQTLPPFLRDHPEPFAFVHMDADLYHSTRTVFELAESRFQAGTIILFDEYFNVVDWENHEHKALMEFVARSGHHFEYVAYSGLGEQVLARITE